MERYKIINPHGLNGPAWERTYGDRDDAAEAIRRAYGWSEIVESEEFESDYGPAWAYYSSQEDCDRDDTGAFAPWVETAPDEEDKTCMLND